MQIRCYHCHMPINITRDMVHAALDYLEEENLPHYDIRCPKCRKVNRISREQLMHAAPTWKKERAEEKEEKDEKPVTAESKKGKKGTGKEK